MIEKQIGHRFHVFVASVIQTRQLERAFERLEERQVRVELIAFFRHGCHGLCPRWSGLG